MKYRDLKIGTQIFIGFASMILFVIIIGFISTRQTHIMHQQIEIMQKHPYTIRRALGELNADILKIRVGTRDLMLANDEQEVDDALQLIEKSTHDVELIFDTLREYYLGPKEDVKEAYDAYVIWNTTREESVKKGLAKDLEYLQESIKATGKVGKYRETMLRKISIINDTSFKISTQLYEKSNQLNASIKTQTLLIVFVLITISLIIGYYLLRNIRRPINELTAAAKRFHNGDLDARSLVFSKNEFGVLTDAFNSLTDQIKQQMTLNKMETNLAASMLREEDTHRFFQSLLPQLASYTNSQIAAVYILNNEKTHFEHFESFGMNDAAKSSFSALGFEGEFGQVLLSRKISFVKSIPLDTRFIYNAVSGTVVPREIVTIPILAGDEIVAIISLASIRKYTEDAILLIENIYDTLNARIEGVLAYQQLKYFSSILEKQKEELALAGTYNRCLIEASIDPLVTIGPDGKITDVNHSTELITGLNRTDLIGTDFANYFTNSEKAKAVYQLVFKEGAVRDYELELRHLNGSVTPVLYNATVYKDQTGKVIGVFAAARDVTESKRVERELIKLNEELNLRSDNLKALNTELEIQKQELDAQADELSQQNAELEMQKNQLNEANRLKTNFLSNMSHELRTPLNSVIALSGVLNRRLSTIIPEEEYSYLGVIERNGKHLLTLINDILDISRIEAGREEIEVGEFDMNLLLLDITGMIKAQADEKDIALILKNESEQHLLTSDMHKCQHILQNLIGNAIKFTEKGKVEIEVTQEENALKVTVSDTGVGISKKHIAHIFDEFRQADGSTSRKFGGTGLGLAIAKKYAQLLGGSITVTSEIDKGSVFILTLPLHYEAKNGIIEERTYTPLTAKTDPPKPTENEGYGKTILVVEDSEPAVVQLRDFLEESGYKVVVANNGIEALEIISNTIPDAMILDLMMPDVDGFEVLKTLRNADTTAHIPVLILTAKHITKDELKFLKRNNIHQLIQKGDVKRNELLLAVSSMVAPKLEETASDESEMLHSNDKIDGKPKILIVEDNPDNMITVKAVLGNEFTILEAYDGLEGVKMAKQHKPDIILMDIALPKMDGVEAFKNIRNHGNLSHVPVIALTASAMEHDRETILAHGFDAYLVKPIDEKVFFSTINKVLYGK